MVRFTGEMGIKQWDEINSEEAYTHFFCSCNFTTHSLICELLSYDHECVKKIVKMQQHEKTNSPLENILTH